MTLCVVWVVKKKKKKKKKKRKKKKRKRKKKEPTVHLHRYLDLELDLEMDTHHPSSIITRHQVAFTLSQGQRIVLFSCVIVKNILLFYTLSMQYIIRLQMYVYSIFYCINFTIFLNTVPADELLYVILYCTVQ